MMWLLAIAVFLFAIQACIVCIRLHKDRQEIRSLISPIDIFELQMPMATVVILVAVPVDALEEDLEIANVQVVE